MDKKPKMKVAISAVILTKNEEGNIGRCLDHLCWCGEVIVIDDYSTDNTVRIAKSRGARVFKRRLNRDFAGQRNFALTKAKNDWVLFLDADEVVSPSLTSEIVRRVREDRYDGFYLSRREVFIGQPLKSADKPIWDWSLGPIKLLRLGKKKKGQWVGRVHERWLIKGQVGQLKTPLLHYSFPDLTTALKKINFYSSIQANKLKAKGIKTSWWQIIIYPLGKFLKNFFWHQGWRDGTRGLIFAFLMSFHSYLVRAKLWSLIRVDK